MEILIVVLVTLAIALVAGILLAWFSHIFAVEEDILKKKIRDCLPGANCGACGYTGCDDYAEAVKDGRAKTNLCIPGAQGVADEISQIMGVEPGEIEEHISFVGCDGNCDSVNKIAQYKGMKSCKAVSTLFGGDNSCTYGCLGLGDCASVCPSQAICLDKGIARINTSVCTGCGLCVDACPKKIIRVMPRNTKTVMYCSNKQKGADARKACSNACIGCKKCEKACPNGAITVNDNLASIDYNKCSNCGECAAQCPTGCLKSFILQ